MPVAQGREPRLVSLGGCPWAGRWHGASGYHVPGSAARARRLGDSEGAGRQQGPSRPRLRWQVVGGLEREVRGAAGEPWNAPRPGGLLASSQRVMGK